jgi:hypothetical protein
LGFLENLQEFYTCWWKKPLFLRVYCLTKKYQFRLILYFYILSKLSLIKRRIRKNLQYIRCNYTLKWHTFKESQIY